jgi:hypothetical protein
MNNALAILLAAVLGCRLGPIAIPVTIALLVAHALGCQILHAYDSRPERAPRSQLPPARILGGRR